MPSPWSGSWSGRRTTCAASARLYLGGGTPSLLGPDRLERLLELFRPQLTPHAEVTVETNPEDVDDGYAAWAAAAPVAGAAGAARGIRISLGAQSFSPALRAVLGRTAAADPAAAYRRLRRAGVANVGLDLIHGIPGQTPELLGADIAGVVELRPDHVSWYELDVIEGTALAGRLTAAVRAGAGGTLEPAAMPADPMDDVRAAGYRRIVRRALPRGLRLVRGQQLRPPGAEGAPQRGVLARPPVSGSWAGRREHRRRPALDQRARPGRVGGGAGRGREPAEDRRAARRRHARGRAPSARGPLW